VTDRIVLANMRFDGRHGDHDWERATPQPFEVDVELRMDLAAAGRSDELTTTVDYGRVFDRVREIVESRTFHLLERLAETIAAEILSAFPLVDEIDVRVRKPKVKLSGRLDYAGVEISRRRA
jgi:7,8-dihydroneopterin aldolase/epimerase/oxygenase